MKINASVKEGHGVASGKVNDPRYPKGTIKIQRDFFLKKGLDLSSYYPGTINLDIAPYFIKIKNPKYFLKDINWSEFIPPENFYFFDVFLQYHQSTHQGLIYMPDPATKADHFQNPAVIELLLPKIDGLKYGDRVMVEVDDSQLALIR